MAFQVGNQVAVSRGVKEHAVQCEGAGTLTSVQYIFIGVGTYIRLEGPKDRSTRSACDFFDHTHISFEPRPFLHQRGCMTSEARGFLAVERAVSQVERTI